MNEIHNESCNNTLLSLDAGSIDGVITSPPYNTMSGISDRGYDIYEDNLSDEEYISWTIEIFNGFSNALKEDGVVLYNMNYGNNNTTLMNLVVADIIRNTDFTLADIIVWHKTNGATPNNVSHNKITRIVEFIYVFCRKDEIKTFKTNKKLLYKSKTGNNIYENVFNLIKAKNNDGVQDLNKATYSTELVDNLINRYFKEGSVIYDPFMGTGTTAVSCIRNNCGYIGSEISKAQCEYAENRIKEANGIVGLFEQKEVCLDL